MFFALEIMGLISTPVNCPLGFFPLMPNNCAVKLGVYFFGCLAPLNALLTSLSIICGLNGIAGISNELALILGLGDGLGLLEGLGDGDGLGDKLLDKLLDILLDCEGLGDKLFDMLFDNDNDWLGEKLGDILADKLLDGDMLGAGL